MTGKIIKIMSKVFKLDENELNDDSSIENVKPWDSLMHINFILSLEEEFDCEFSSDEIIQMISIKKIVSILENK